MNKKQLKEAITQTINECNNLHTLSVIYRFAKMIIYGDTHYNKQNCQNDSLETSENIGSK